jgi:hypothetical protein
LSVGAGQREVRNSGGIESNLAGRTRGHLHRTDVLTHGSHRNAIEQELQLLCNGAGSQSHGLQTVLLQGEVQRRYARPPVGVDRAHHRARVHDMLHVGRDTAQRLRIGPGHAVGNGEWRIRTEHELRDAYARFGRQTVGDGLTQALLQRLTLFLAIGPDHDLGE